MKWLERLKTRYPSSTEMKAQTIQRLENRGLSIPESLKK